MVVVLRGARVDWTVGKSTTEKKSQSNGVKTKRKRKVPETNPTKIRDPFRLGHLLFICQTSNLDQNRVKGWRHVPIRLLLLPLIGTKRGGGQRKENERGIKK